MTGETKIRTQDPKSSSTYKETKYHDEQRPSLPQTLDWSTHIGVCSIDKGTEPKEHKDHIIVGIIETSKIFVIVLCSLHGPYRIPNTTCELFIIDNFRWSSIDK